MTSRVPQEIALVDTNTLHYIVLYLRFADKHSLFPFPATPSLVSHARKQIATLGEKALIHSLRRGLSTVSWLLSRRAQVQYASVSQLELMHGRSRGRVIESFAREGVPDRFWRIPPEDVAEQRLTVSDLESICREVKRLPEGFLGIGLQSPNTMLAEAEVWTLSIELMGLVYIAVADSIILATALCNQIDFLITSDQYLQSVVNRICMPQCDRYRMIRKRVQKLIAQTIPSDPSDVNLPRAFSISASGATIPDVIGTAG